MIRHYRLPDDDLVSYLQYNQEIFTRDNILDILAEVPGHNDEDCWYWIIELKNSLEGGKFLLTSAMCDYTGWNCHSSGESTVHQSAFKAASSAPLKESGTGRAIRHNLIMQLRKESPIGLEVRSPYD